MKERSKAAALASIEHEHHLLAQTLALLSDMQLVAPTVFPDGDQSCKDILAHLTAWEQRMRAIVRAIVAGAPLPPYPPTPRFNEQVFQANKDRPLQDVQLDFVRSYYETLAFVRQLTEQDLAIDAVWKLVGYNTTNHYRWARTMIRRWQRLATA